jgi:diketogulonate reductase-like aldo/keto reductase
LSRRPVAFKKEPYEKEQKIVIDEALTEDPYPTWKKLEELVDKGKIRNIGVSK